LVRAILWFARKFLLVVPSALIAVLGYSYIRLCYLELLSPNKPIEFRYKGAGGDVIIRARSYSLDPYHGQIRVSQLIVQAPSGGSVVAASAVDVTQLDLRRGMAQSPKIDIYRLTGSVERLSNGKFQLEELIPSSTGKSTSNFPFRITVHGANVKLTDRRGSVWSQRAVAQTVEISGAGADWVAHGSATLPGIGSVTASLQNASRVGLRVQGSTSGLKCEALLRHVFADRSLHMLDRLRDARVDRLAVSGPFNVFIASDLKFGFRAGITVAARGLAWKAYRLDKLNFSGIVGPEGGEGSLKVAEGLNHASALGSVKIAKTVEGSAKVTLACPSVRALPAEIVKKFPPGIDFQGGKFDGWVALRKGSPITAQGTAFAAQVTYRKEVAKNLRAAIVATPQTVRADIQQVVLAGANPVGSVTVDLGAKSVLGYVQGNGLDLGRIGALTHTQGLSGTGSFRAIATGSLARPLVEFVADAVGRYHRQSLSLGPDEVHAVGTFQNNVVNIRRGLVSGADGLVTVTGNGASNGTDLKMDVEARNIRLSRFVPGVSGLITASGTVVGDYRNPKASGTLRAIDLAYHGQRAPVAGADFTADRNHVEVTHVGAMSGTMDLAGGGSLAFKNSQLRGRFSVSGIELAQFAGDKAAGIVDAPTIQVNGTLSHPTVVARLEGQHLIGGNVLIDNAEAFVTANGQSATVDHATADFAGGTLSATGSYDFGAKSGNGVVTSTAFDLSKLAPALGETLTLAGSASVVEGKVAYRDGVISGAASGKLDKLTANNVPVGDGNWTVGLTGDAIQVGLSVGQLQPILRVVDLDATYNIKDKTIAGTFDADRAHLSDIISASMRYLPDSRTADSATLFGLTGDLTLGATFSGRIDAPDLSLDTLTLAQIHFKGTSFGDLTADKISRKNRVWTIPNLRLLGPEGEIDAAGTVAETGNIDAKISGNDLKAAALQNLIPSLAGSKGVAKFTIEAAGETKNPTLVATANLDHVIEAPFPVGASSGQDLSVSIPKISLSEGKLSFNGTFGFDGFGGSLGGAVPLTLQHGLGTGPVDAHLTLHQRELKDLPFVDPARSRATVSGSITATGPLRDLAVRGGISLNADSLALRSTNPTALIKRVDDEFKSVKASLSLNDSGEAVFDLSAGVLRGGAISMKATSPLPDFGALQGYDISKIESVILNSPIQGLLQMKGFQLRQSLAGGYVAGTINGQVPIGGTIKNPAIGTESAPGVFSLSDVDTTLPTFQPGNGSSKPPLINPTFNLSANFANPAHAKSSTAEVSLTGGASLHGSLADPSARADLAVAAGTVRLPGGTVRLTSGGTLRFAYGRTFGDVSSDSLDVDLQGRTSITAIRYGQNTQRYDITVYISGDLLQANGLHFDATSDPPDLSPDDVLNLLGEKDLLTSLGTADQTEAEQRIRDALVGFAIPTVLDPYTSTLAKNLGLDYISLEYNSVNLATLGVARSIGPDFTLQYRQQVGTPPPGYRAIYDLRLVFTPKKGPPIFRRFSLSLGTDQDRPWKIALEYGSRFGGYSGPAVQNKTTISGPPKQNPQAPQN
jgi:hypothetical protein